MNNVLAIIPARGGSKGLYRKNIKTLLGKPLIQYTIDSALSAKLVSDVVVSTEDSEIASICSSFGVRVVNRPYSLATDTARSEEVVKHALTNLEKVYDVVILLQPTSPIRTANDIDSSLSLFFEGGVKSIFSICQLEHHPHKCFIDKGGFLKPLGRAEDLGKPRQELPKSWRQNGAIYCVRVSDFLKNNSFYIEPALGYEMSIEKSLDIDVISDFEKAEEILLAKSEK